MSIRISKSSLFGQGLPIRYLMGWHDEFKKEKGNGALSFYDGNPAYIVNVELLTVDKRNLQEEDILVTAGSYHNPDDIEIYIKSKKDAIFEFCKMYNGTRFALDLERMKSIEKEDFFCYLPVQGLNTLFMFENINNEYFCLVNSSRNIPDAGFYSWFIAYIYSLNVCLAPRNKIESYSNEFFQALSGLAAHQGNRKAVHISSNRSILNCPLNDIGEFLVDVPGRTDRFEKLVEKSIEQMKNPKDKKKGKHKR